MGKRKRSRKDQSERSTRSKAEEYVEEDEREVDPDPKSRSYVYDEIDEYHASREKLLLESGTKYATADYSEDEEVYGLNVDSDDDDDNIIAMHQKAEAARKLDEMASDLEEDNDDGLPDAMAWGKHRLAYYADKNDYVDKDYGGYNESDLEMAESEEKEAKAIQLRMAEQLDDTDFGFDQFQKPQKITENDEEKTPLPIIKRDLSCLSHKEKLELLNRESPELTSLLADFQDKLSEVMNRFQPLVELVKNGKIPAGSGADYINMKHALLMNYCTNVCFYTMLKAKRETDMAHHPIVQRLVTYRKLLKESEQLDITFANEVTDLLNRKDQTIEDVLAKIVRKNRLKQKGKLRTLLRREKDTNVSPADSNLPSSDLHDEHSSEPLMNKKVRFETEDETRALELYEMMKSGRRSTHMQSDNEDDEEEDEQDDYDDDDDDNEQNADGELGQKRGITYQIAKNKGLTPYRKKEVRNPRVKHRKKYRKAKIQRKGQVREARTEMTRYGGEFSGIKATTSRSIKLK